MLTSCKKFIEAEKKGTITGSKACRGK